MPLLHDVKFGLRMLARPPVVTTVAVLSIPDLYDLVEAGRSLESSMACPMELANLHRARRTRGQRVDIKRLI
jgi:hypothetical protein